MVLLVAHGQGPCDSFCVVQVDDAADLIHIHPGDPIGRLPASEGKWTDLALTAGGVRRWSVSQTEASDDPIEWTPEQP